MLLEYLCGLPRKEGKTDYNRRSPTAFIISDHINGGCLETSLAQHKLICLSF